jgi:hypothetical protein
MILAISEQLEGLWNNEIGEKQGDAKTSAHDIRLAE